ncbi:antitoxin family protein [Pyrodictium abyssi]|uniref:Antitoxin n=1 Tax=Pyrodictium abyssi TaxID=54256 RepID=A0ABN6ZVG8_9CREN|nr:hypothetical protein PABY_19530 [Pyrodictium abyssi]
MSRVVEAVYEKDVLRPLEDPGLEEGERVRLVIVRRDLSRYRGVLGRASYRELKRLEDEAQLQP